MVPCLECQNFDRGVTIYGAVLSCAVFIVWPLAERGQLGRQDQPAGHRASGPHQGFHQLARLGGDNSRRDDDEEPATRCPRKMTVSRGPRLGWQREVAD
jgi:hypothetical protein